MNSSMPVTEHPTWCNDHEGFDDNSSSWHKSADLRVGQCVLYISTGTDLGDQPAISIEGVDHGMSLDDAEAVGRALLGLIVEARREHASEADRR